MTGPTFGQSLWVWVSLHQYLKDRTNCPAGRLVQEGRHDEQLPGIMAKLVCQIRPVLSLKPGTVISDETHLALV